MWNSSIRCLYYDMMTPPECVRIVSGRINRVIGILLRILSVWKENLYKWCEGFTLHVSMFQHSKSWVISSYSEGLYNVEVIGILFNICVSNGDLKKCCSQLIVINVEELYNTWAPRRWPFDPRRILKHDCWWTRAFDVENWDCAIYLACLDDGASEDSPF